MIIEIICPKCNFSKKVPKEKIPAGVRKATCPRCKEIFEFEPLGSGPDFQQEQGETPLSPPWERRDDLGMWQGIYQTFKSVLFSPKEFFGNTAHEDGIKDPLAFGLLLGAMGTMFGFFWQFLVMSGRIHSFSTGLLDQFSINLIFLGIIIISPLFVLLNMFVTGGIIHACLFIVRGDKGGFEGTFRVIAYSQATMVLSFIPFIGGLIGGIWNLVVIIIGLRNIHDTSYFRAIVSILFTLVFKILMLLPLFLIKFIVNSLRFLG